MEYHTERRVSDQYKSEKDGPNQHEASLNQSDVVSQHGVIFVQTTPSYRPHTQLVQSTTPYRAARGAALCILWGRLDTLPPSADRLLASEQHAATRSRRDRAGSAPGGKQRQTRPAERWTDVIREERHQRARHQRGTSSERHQRAQRRPVERSIWDGDRDAGAGSVISGVCRRYPPLLFLCDYCER